MPLGKKGKKDKEKVEDDDDDEEKENREQNEQVNLECKLLSTRYLFIYFFPLLFSGKDRSLNTSYNVENEKIEREPLSSEKSGGGDGKSPGGKNKNKRLVSF